MCDIPYTKHEHGTLRAIKSLPSHTQHMQARAHTHTRTRTRTRTSTQSTKNGYKDTNNACAIFLIVGVHTKHVHGTLRVNYVVAAFAFREQLCGDDFHTETLDRFSQLSEKES